MFNFPPAAVAEWLWNCTAEIEVAGSIPAAAAVFRWRRNAKTPCNLTLKNPRW